MPRWTRVGTAEIKLPPKSHKRRSCCSGESDVNTYEDVSPLQMERLVRLLFSDVFTAAAY